MLSKAVFSPFPPALQCPFLISGPLFTSHALPLPAATLPLMAPPRVLLPCQPHPFPAPASRAPRDCLQRFVRVLRAAGSAHRDLALNFIFVFVPFNKMQEAIVCLATASGPEQFSLKFAPCARVVARVGWIVLWAENRLQNNSSNCLSFPCWTQ